VLCCVSRDVEKLQIEKCKMGVESGEWMLCE
jgi:hypothetical protein